MQKKTILKVLNPILALLLINQAASAILLEPLSPEAFEILHKGGGVLLVVAAVLHLALNWNWVKATYVGKR